MAKRSRKLSTRRPRRSNSNSRKTMKRTTRQPSKKHTLKKHSSKKHTLKKHSSKKPKKVKRKSIRKRKKSKKIIKGGKFDGTYTPVFENGNVNINNIKEFDNGETIELLTGKSEGTWLIRQRENPLDNKGAYILATKEKTSLRLFAIMESNQTTNITYWFRSKPDKLYTSLENLIKMNPNLFPKEKELKEEEPIYRPIYESLPRSEL